MGTKSQNAAKILVLLLVLCGMRGDEGEGGGDTITLLLVRS